MQRLYHIHISFTMKQLVTTVIRIILTFVVFWTIIYCPWLIWDKFPFFEHQAALSQYCISAAFSITVCMIFGVLFKFICSGDFRLNFSVTAALMFSSLYAIYALVAPTLNGVQYNRNAAMNIYRIINIVFILMDFMLLNRGHFKKETIVSLLPFVLFIFISYSDSLFESFLLISILTIAFAGGSVIHKFKKRKVFN